MAMRYSSSHWIVGRVAPFLLALCLSLAAALVVVKADQAERQASDDTERSQIQDQLGIVRARLERALIIPMARTRGMEAQIIAHGDVAPPEFNKIAEVLLRGHSTIRYLSVSHGTLVDLIYPLAGHEHILGINYQDLGPSWLLIKHAIDHGLIAIEGPDVGTDGDGDLLVRHPVTLPESPSGAGRLFGVISVALDVRTIYAEAGLDREDLPIQVAIRGRDGLGEKGDLIKGDPSVFLHHPVEMDVHFPYGTWRLAAIPKAGWGSLDQNLLMSRLLGGGGLIFVIFISFGTAYHIVGRSRFHHMVEISEQRYRCLLQFACDGVHILDRDGNLVIWSASFLRMLGYSEAEAATLHVANWDAVFPREAIGARIMALLAEPGVFQTRHRRRDGSEFDVEISAGGIELAGTRYLYASSRDISERRRAEAEISRYRDHLESLVAERTAALAEARDRADDANRAKSTFLANISHEIRTPLNAVLGFSHIMLGSPTLDPNDREIVAVIHRSGRALLALINEVIEMSKIEASRVVVSPKPLDLHKLLKEVGELFQRRASAKKLLSEVVWSSELPRYIVMDGVKLRQILINLSKNTLKCTDNGSVALRVADRDDNDGRLVFEFEDSGGGMSTAEIGGLFEPFRQSTRGTESGGSGLDLAISRRHARLMGGDITVVSVEGQGSIFRLDLPLQKATAADCKVMESYSNGQNQAIYPEKDRVMVVDDQADHRASLIRLLEPYGFALREAANGCEALDLWQTWRPHLIIMDVVLPVMDGGEATRRIRATPDGAEVVIVALSARAFDEDRAAVMATGANVLLRKPVAVENLLTVIRQHLKVEYAGADEPEADDHFSERPFTPLQREMIDSISPDLLEAMRRAVFRSDDQRLTALIDQLPAEPAGLAFGLRRLAAKFDWEALDNVLGPNDDQQPGTRSKAGD